MEKWPTEQVERLCMCVLGASDILLLSTQHLQPTWLLSTQQAHAKSRDLITIHDTSPLK